ncbi:MAG: UDP-glucose/GDP-mannose dehydrogenase family protein [Armatimonadota bacterium]|nr:UDP-glucose/GDP-mannose dehydrogenase family protein [bacterium]MCS7309236.1 UDP-glucose/GDP-mannose dehydrogenase family protein [Armatimonadota bacterium]MDW8289627.1 UDP-glucose/GDP-mannose dehydrogenase family protein [Armatimonadota bacterium]
MRIAVFGLGYVGAVTAACLADAGHSVIGVDVDAYKVSCINEGRSPIVERDLEDYIRRARAGGRLIATSNAEEAVSQSDLALVCVGTPSRRNGSLNLEFVERVCHQIGTALASCEAAYTVVIRSTVLPGTCEELVIPVLESASGKRHGEGFFVCMNPEFLREGSAIHDFHHPPLTIIGAQHDEAANQVAELYAHLPAECVKTDLRTAETVKYANNAFHALKITFANEIGAWCKQEGVDSHLVMRLLTMDTKLNISPAYLTPGFAFGGSCLPKDLRALVYRAHQHDLNLPLLESILVSNRLQIERTAELIVQLGKKHVGVVGLAFKAGTDDLRESPVVTLCEYLIGKGFALRIYDPNVSLSAIYGSNKAYIEREIPHIHALMCDSLPQLIEHSEVVVLANRDDRVTQHSHLFRDDQTVIDLARSISAKTIRGRYIGLYW